MSPNRIFAWLLLTFASELTAAFLWSSAVFGEMDLRWGWLAHGLAVCFLAGGLFQSGITIRGAGRSMVLLLCIFVASVPIFGPVLMVALILVRSFSSSAVSVNQFIGPDEVYDADQSSGADSLEIGPDILSILRSGDPVRRRRAILGVRSYEPVAAVPVLRRCLQDSDELVRIYAQGILQTLVEGFEGRANDLRSRLKERSLDPEERIDLELQLAEVLHEQIYAGLVEEEAVRMRVRQQVCACLDRAIAIAPERVDLYLLRLRYLLDLRDLQAAEADLRRIEQSRMSPVQVEPLRCELNFLRCDWAGLREQLGSIERSGLAHGRMLEVCAFWREAHT
ncbi:MAG: hypothetical protein ACLFU4_00330 [Opitutales bacterium]